MNSVCINLAGWPLILRNFGYAVDSRSLSHVGAGTFESFK